MIDPKHPLAVLAARLPWDNKMQAAIEPAFAHTARPVKVGDKQQDFAGRGQLDQWRSHQQCAPPLARAALDGLEPNALYTSQKLFVNHQLQAVKY